MLSVVRYGINSSLSLDVPAEGQHDLAVIASAAVAVRYDLP